MMREPNTVPIPAPEKKKKNIPKWEQISYKIHHYKNKDIANFKQISKINKVLEIQHWWTQKKNNKYYINSSWTKKKKKVIN